MRWTRLLWGNGCAGYRICSGSSKPHGDEAGPPHEYRLSRARAAAGPQIRAGGLLALAAAVGVGHLVYTRIFPCMLEALGMTNGAVDLQGRPHF